MLTCLFYGFFGAQGPWARYVTATKLLAPRRWSSEKTLLPLIVTQTRTENITTTSSGSVQTKASKCNLYHLPTAAYLTLPKDGSLPCTWNCHRPSDYGYWRYNCRFSLIMFSGSLLQWYSYRISSCSYSRKERTLLCYILYLFFICL